MRLGFVATALAAVTCLTCMALAERPPNIVVIMVDDMGYEGVSCFGNPYFKTPEIDRLAADGLKLTDFHANGSLCSPTRAALMTGLYQQRVGIPGVINADPAKESHAHGIALEHWTFPEAMKSGGYATAVFGKWHLGYREECNPVHHGFDQFIGFISGNIDYHSHYDRMETFDWYHGTELNYEKGFHTDLSTDDTVDFIRENKSRPFFAYLAYGSPHAPNQGRSSVIQRGPDKGKFPDYAPKVALDGKPGDDNWVVRDMIVAVDDGVGKIRLTIEELGLAENTIVWFFSDNGGTVRNKTTGKRLRGIKGSVYEGGHRVPAVVWAPGRIEPGRVSGQTVMTMDLMPTSTAMAGIQAPAEHAFDGRDVSSLLFEDKALPQRTLFWANKSDHWAARDGNWKIVRHRGGLQLYNLKDDIGEKNNLANHHPERVAALTKAARAWYADVTHGQSLETLPPRK